MQKQPLLTLKKMCVFNIFIYYIFEDNIWNVHADWLVFIGEYVSCLLIGWLSISAGNLQQCVRSHTYFNESRRECKMRHRMTKPTKWPLRPAKTQISLGIRPVWSESSLSTWRNIGPLTTYWAHREDSDQTGLMPRLNWVFAGHTSFCWFSGAAAQMFHPYG